MLHLPIEVGVLVILLSIVSCSCSSSSLFQSLLLVEPLHACLVILKLHVRRLPLILIVGAREMRRMRILSIDWFYLLLLRTKLNLCILVQWVSELRHSILVKVELLTIMMSNFSILVLDWYLTWRHSISKSSHRFCISFTILISFVPALLSYGLPPCFCWRNFIFKVLFAIRIC